MFKERERQIQAFWKKKKIYEKAKRKVNGKKKFYFLDGPPYATGNVHIGTAWNKILKDAYIRFWRLRGFDVWDQPGYDTHGLPIENQVEKKLQIKSKADIERLGIGKFVTECRKFATQFIGVMNSQFENLGVWMDWKNPYLTLRNEYIEGGWATFKTAYEKGLLYHGFYSVHVCSHCETAVAYNEIEYTKLSDPSVYVKFPVKGRKNEFFVIWTTTPWTLPANTGIMAKPSAEYVKAKVGDQVLIMAKELAGTVMKKIGAADYKIIGTLTGKELEGMQYQHPLRDVFQFLSGLKNAHRIVLSEQYVSLEEGTGLVHTAPGHGEEDYKVGKEAGLPVVSPVKLNGTFNESCGEFAGVYVKHADRKIIDILRERGLLLTEEKITHDYPQCWRCSTPLLQMAVPQWFFKVTAIRDKLIRENENVVWVPDWAKQRFRNWLESLGDWPISRQRYWGIPLPIWVCENCEAVKVVGSLAELKARIKDLHRPHIDGVYLKCSCGGRMKRIPDVLDVWFDAGLAGWASLGYPKSTKLFRRLWPSDLQLEGPDQIRGWWNAELITSYITFGRAPFKRILFHGFILDAHGAKMSKSKGNVVSPDDVVNKYGRDILRFYLLSSPAWNDFFFNWSEMEKISRAFGVMDNTINFVRTYAKKTGKPRSLRTEDRWILSRLHSLAEAVTKSLEANEAHRACSGIHDFVINDFSRWYIKLVRERVWPEKDKAAMYTLLEVSRVLAGLLSPLTPFFAEHIYQTLRLGKADSVHLLGWPKPEKRFVDVKLENGMNAAKQIVEAANAIRHESKIKARWPLRRLVVEGSKLGQFEGVIKFMANVKDVEYGTAKGGRDLGFAKIWLETKLDKELLEEALLREVIRKIQEMRKQRNLVVSDMITLVLEDAEDIRKHKKRLMKEVGAKKVAFGKTKGEKLEWEGRLIGIEIKA